MSTVAPASRPGSVTAAYVIWLIGAILVLIASIFAVFVGIIAVTGGIAVGGLYGGALGMVVLMFAVFVFAIAIIELAIVNRMRDGRRWARVTLTVLGILSLLGSIVPWVSGGWDGSSSWGGLLGVIVVLLAIILMYAPAANAYFRAGGVTAEYTGITPTAAAAPAAPPTTAMPATPGAPAAPAAPAAPTQPPADPGSGTRPPTV